MNVEAINVNQTTLFQRSTPELSPWQGLIIMGLYRLCITDRWWVCESKTWSESERILKLMFSVVIDCLLVSGSLETMIAFLPLVVIISLQFPAGFCCFDNNGGLVVQKFNSFKPGVPFVGHRQTV